MGEKIMTNKNKNDFHLNIKGIKEKTETAYGSYQLNELIFKFFNSPINKRYTDEPSQKDFELVDPYAI